MKNIIKYFLSLILFTILIINCNSSVSSVENPEWVKNLILKFETEPVGNPPQIIWQFEYKSQIVYYIPPQCCDEFNNLYDKNGEFICSPDCGITGRGDGLCSDFFQARKNENLFGKINENCEFIYYQI